MASSNTKNVLLVRPSNGYFLDEIWERNHIFWILLILTPKNKSRFDRNFSKCAPNFPENTVRQEFVSRDLPTASLNKYSGVMFEGMELFF